jgi:type I restriction enzyme M protein
MATVRATVDIGDIEKRLWDSADELRANSGLKASEYSIPMLGLIFLKYADSRFADVERELAGTASSRRPVGREDYQATGVMFLPPEARYAYLLNLPEGSNLGQAVNDAMKAIEDQNEELRGVLPRTYTALTNATLATLLRNVDAMLGAIEGDGFGKVYEYFLGKFAMAEGQKGGEFFTPTSLVRLIVEIIEPFGGKILDPAAGSGGMFVQSERFRERHRQGSAGRRLSLYGQERVEETVKLCKMNLAVHGLGGQVRQANTYYEDGFDSVGAFDFVMANPPFNVNRIDKTKLTDDPRFPFGLPRSDNGNYLWMQIFYSALNEKGRAGFVMANSAADAGGSELEIRKKLIQDRVIDVVVSIGPNFFYTVTLPCTLWFYDKAKRIPGTRDIHHARAGAGQVGTPDEGGRPPEHPHQSSDTPFVTDARPDIHDAHTAAEQVGAPDEGGLVPEPHDRSGTILFIDARNTFRQIDRAHREFTDEQIDFLADIARLYRDEEVAEGEAPEGLRKHFLDGTYVDVPGLCRVASIDEIEAQGWSLNPGRYVGVTVGEDDGFEFAVRFEELNEELEKLNLEAAEL